MRIDHEALTGTPTAIAAPGTFAQYGNLFGAGIPVTLDEAIRSGKVKNGSLLALGGFAHAGDYAAAAIVRWRA